MLSRDLCSVSPGAFPVHTGVQSTWALREGGPPSLLQPQRLRERGGASGPRSQAAWDSVPAPPPSAQALAIVTELVVWSLEVQSVTELPSSGAWENCNNLPLRVLGGIEGANTYKTLRTA